MAQRKDLASLHLPDEVVAQHPELKIYQQQRARPGHGRRASAQQRLAAVAADGTPSALLPAGGIKHALSVTDLSTGVASTPTAAQSSGEKRLRLSAPAAASDALPIERFDGEELNVDRRHMTDPDVKPECLVIKQEGVKVEADNNGVKTTTADDSSHPTPAKPTELPTPASTRDAASPPLSRPSLDSSLTCATEVVSNNGTAPTPVTNNSAAT